jgi:LL-diaminopimelate aminotransferase
MEPAKRVKRIAPNYFTVINKNVLEQLSMGRDVIRLDIGSPDLPPPSEVINVLSETVLDPKVHGYQPHNGSEDLRQAWASFYLKHYGVKVEPNKEIITLLGSKEGIFHLTQALINPGDVVLIPDPGYLTYTQATLFAGGIPYPIPLKKENNYLPDLFAIPEMVLKKVKIIWLNYPNNPTGATTSLEFFRKVINFAESYGILVCHDAAYSLVTFNENFAPSILQIDGAKEYAIEFNSLSKAYNMAGWRVGVAVGNHEVLQSLYKVKTNVDSGHFYSITKAATTALSMDDKWIRGRNNIYKKRGLIVIEGLQEIGIDVRHPEGTIYIWAPVPKNWKRSTDFTKALLLETGVSVTPGRVFGDYGDKFFRISLTTDEQKIKVAMDRIKEWMIND